MISFHPLASGSGRNAYVCKADGCQPLLVDAGIPYQALQRKLWAEGTSGAGLAGCLVSHGHSDHCEAVPKLMRAGVDIYASDDTLHEITAFGHHRAKVLTAGEITTIGGWRVLPFAVPHDRFVMGFMIEGGGKRLVYCTDLAYAPDRFEGVNVLAIECNFSEALIRENVLAGAISTDRFKRTVSSHMSIERLIVLLRENDLSRCEAIYLLHGSAMNSDSADFKRQIQAATGVCTYVCKEHGGVE